MPSSAAHVVAVRTGGICLWPRWRRQTSLPQSSEGGQGHGCHSELKRGAQGCAGRTFPLQRVSLEGKGWRGPPAGAPGSGVGRKRRRRAEPEAVLEVTLPLPPGPRPCLRGPILQLYGLRWPPEAARLSQRPWPRTAPSPVQTRLPGDSAAVGPEGDVSELSELAQGKETWAAGTVHAHEAEPGPPSRQEATLPESS